MIAMTTVLGAVSDLTRDGRPTNGAAISERLGVDGRNVRNSLSRAVQDGLLLSGGFGRHSTGYRLTEEGRRRLLLARCATRLEWMPANELERVLLVLDTWDLP